MTCIVALIEGNKTYMAADSTAFNTHRWVKQTRKDKKLFYGNTMSGQKFMIGYTTSYRMGQLLACEFVPSGYINNSGPDNEISEDDLFKYMVTTFVKELKALFKANGFGTIKEGENAEGGTFIVAINKKIYEIGSDFQVADPEKAYLACGCGSDYAYASLFTSEVCNDFANLQPNKDYVISLNATERLDTAIKAAMEFSSYVGGEIHFLELEH